MKKIIVGQRYMSIAEPELGLGIVYELEDKFLVISYPAAEETRRYGIKTAPLKRIRFEVGDDIDSNSGLQFTIQKVITSESGLLVYLGDIEKNEDHLILETDILDSISFHRPEEKLLNARPDKFSLFQLRSDTFKYRAWLARNNARGLIGARITLIEHQYYLADTISQRLYPRVLLADEVGLGKTIETGLILHKLITTGRAERVLIVTPTTLNFQWFIEMLRKYNLSFSIINEQSELDMSVNSFDENNLVITSLEFISGTDFAKAQIVEANWDLLIVDEAHKLGWSEKLISNEYKIIESLSKKIKGLLLLTATPEIHGAEQHFSHLKLIDPERFQSFTKYKKEEKKFKEIAIQSRQLIEQENLSVNHPKVQELIDCHGPGRVIFRNTREVIDKDYKFFPIRHLKEYPLISSTDKDRELFNNKVAWLIEFLQANQNKKVLLICNSKEKVLKIKKDLEVLSAGNKIGVFHEKLSLMARDRQAAYFREDDGSNLLICSEIGSEGRNFQFCQNLILFDLPELPDLLEQRIGRLDRIGQKENIFIHVPYSKNTYEEFIFNWYHQVFEAFSTSVKGATEIKNKFFEAYREAYKLPEKRKDIITKAQKSFISLNSELQQGRDILIELNSFNKEKASNIVNQIKEIDESPNLKEYLDSIYTHFGVDAEDLDKYSQFIRPSDNMYISHFPFLTNDGFSYTFNRQLALEREDLSFMSWDHPMVTGIMELICGEEYGNVTLMTRKNKRVRPFIETFYLLESSAPKSLEIGRFLPPTIIRILVDLEGNEFSDKWSKELLDESLEDAAPEIVHTIAKFSKKDLRKLIKHTKTIVEKKKAEHIKTCSESASIFYHHEIERLKKLQLVNDIISDHEIDQLIKKQELIMNYILSSSIGMDSLRFIY